ncbi:hypothetical protein Trydic_g9712 [Trypoxylus dichotomus]
MFVFEDVIGLKLDELVGPHDTQFVEASAENQEDNYEGMACVPEEDGRVINLDWKTRTVEYWKSGKTKLRSLESVKQKFKKVKSVRQLYKKEESVNRGSMTSSTVDFRS